MDKIIRTLIMGISKWLKRKAAIMSLALASVEKNALGQSKDGLDKSINQERRHTEGTLADALKQGKITQEVMDLRWRTYKIMRASEGYTTEITGTDSNGNYITKTKKLDKTKGLSKVKLDSFDSYPLELVVDNTELASGGNEAMDNNFIKLYDNLVFSVDKDGDEIATHGEIKSSEFFSTNKSEKPVTIGRMFIPKFEIETYTTKLVVRKINETERLLEFYISKYPDIDDKKTTLLISDIKKAIINPLAATFLEIKEVGFVTHKTLGADDFMEYQYDIISLDKIVEFNGYYVIKYKATVRVDGKDIFEEHRMVGLDEKYKKQEKKKQ